MAYRGGKFGPLLYITLFAAVLVLVAVPAWPRVIEQWTAWSFCRQLRDPDQAVRRRAAEGLARLGPAAVPWVIRASRDAVVEARIAACSIVRLVDPDHPQAAVAALIAASGDGQLPVRLTAVEQLKNAISNPAAKGDPRLRDRAVGALRAALADHTPRVRIAAAWGLLQVDPGGSSRMVISAMRVIADDWRPSIRSDHDSALRILKDTIGADGVAAMLIAYLGDPAARNNALDDLTRECPEAKATEPFLVGLLKAADGSIRCDAALFLVGRDPRVAAKALDTLVEQLVDPPDGGYFPANLVRMIRERSPGSLGHVVRATVGSLPGSKGRRFPHAAIETLGAIGPEAKPAVPALLEIADSGDRPLAIAAVAALAKIDPASAATKIPSLIDWAGPGGDTWTRLAAIATLRDLGPAAKAAAQPLVRMADEDDLRVSAAAIEALSRIDPPLAVELKRATRD